MKTLTLVFFALFIFASQTAGNTAMAGAKAPPKTSSFSDSAGWNKIDLRAREAWAEATKGGNASTVFEGILKTKKAPTPDEKTILKSAGFKSRTFIGTIITGSFEAQDLPSIANLDFVEAIELSVPVTIKK